MEHPANIGFRCKKHQKKPDPQYAKKPIKWFLGKHCQLSFPCPGKRKELMWVLVTGPSQAKGEELRGTLNNDPVYAEIRCGDEVEFSRKEILEVL